MLIKLLLVLKMRKKSIKFYIFNTLVGELYIVAEGCRWGTIYCGRRLSLGNYILWQKVVVGELYIVAEGCLWGTIYCGRRLFSRKFSLLKYTNLL